MLLLHEHILTEEQETQLQSRCSRGCSDHSPDNLMKQEGLHSVPEV